MVSLKDECHNETSFKLLPQNRTALTASTNICQDRTDHISPRTSYVELDEHKLAESL
jgi:hypothetical protein